jgi:hypothetical protein
LYVPFEQLDPDSDPAPVPVLVVAVSVNVSKVKLATTVQLLLGIVPLWPLHPVTEATTDPAAGVTVQEYGAPEA